MSATIAPVGSIARTAARLPLLIALIAALALAGLSALAPQTALGGTNLDAKCDGIVLRGRPSPAADRKGRIGSNATVVAVATVAGSGWHTRCGGRSDKGHRWYKIASVNGKSAKSLYGKKYVYAARSLFDVVHMPLEAACDGARLRTSARTGAPSKLKLAEGVRVRASATVSGGNWSTDCGGPSSGHGWYRITRIGSRSVSSIFGVPALYAARGTLRTQGSAPPPGSTTYVDGIDISHWQETIDWVKVAAAGKRYAFMKASEGRKYVDPTYVTNRAQANLNGLKIGAYHFAKPDTDPGDAILEADHFIATAAWAEGDLLPVLDLERTGGLSTAQLQAWTAAFLDRVYVRTGVRAMVYTSPSFWKNKLGDTQQFALAGHHLWIAHWTTAPLPLVPAIEWAGNGWSFWQITSDGSVPGISGRVDLDRFRFGDFDRVTIK
jgi:GH25 family lysozyme M1 (1,4-beta-N-acetylmuramidase)